MAKKPTMMARLMSEVVLCGGQLWTRKGLYEEILADFQGSPDPEKRARATWTADYFAFRMPTATAEEVEALAGGPLDKRCKAAERGVA